MGEPLKWWDKPTVLCGTLTAELIPRKTSALSLNIDSRKSPRKFVSPGSFFALMSSLRDGGEKCPAVTSRERSYGRSTAAAAASAGTAEIFVFLKITAAFAIGEIRGFSLY